MSFAKVIVYGNLTRDPELRYTATGASIVNLSVAVNRKWKDGDGKVQEEVSFLNAVAFGKTADLISGSFHKGDPIMLDGRLKQEMWEKDGEKKSAIKIMVDRIEFVGGRKQATEPAAPAGGGGATAVDEDVPF